MKHFALFLLLISMVSAAPAPPPTTPYIPSLIQDKKGNEWYIEQNGGLQRNGSQPSLIGNAMMLQFGNQQFYCQQPMISQDGHEISLTSPQPMSGLSVSRRVTILDREGGLRYIEQFTNTTNRDLTVSIELRHNFGSQTKGFLSNTGRALKDSLQAEESGIVALPTASEKAMPALLFTLRSPGSSPLPRLSMKNSYQLSIFYSLTIPAGQTTALIHAIAQAKLEADAKSEDVVKAYQPIGMDRLTRDLPRAVLKTAANLQGNARAYGLDDWFPTKPWGIAAETSDLLILDNASQVKGHATAAHAALTSTFGKADVPWNDLTAIAGPAFTESDQSWIWLRDGQRWKGNLEAPGLKFTLTSGADLELTRLKQLIFATQPATAPSQALLETWLGERIAFTPSGHLNLDTPWGPLSAEWTDVIALLPPAGDAIGGTLHLKDGTRLHALPAQGTVTLNTHSFGQQSFDMAQLRQTITPLALKMPEEEGDPTTSFLDLVGDQRLVARVTTASLRLLTRNGPIDLTPATVRELSQVIDEDEPAAAGSPHQFKALLWGGGTVLGTLDNSMLSVEGRGLAWEVPTAQLIRLANPVPITDSALLRRIGTLILDLGQAEWKTRERSTQELREMGILAKSSLQEALKQSTDAEVTRRLESLLSELE